MLDHDSSIPTDYTATRYDLSFSNMTLSLSINVTSIISWVNNELDEYISHHQISRIHDLVDDWQDGRAFLCLVNRYYPIDNAVTTFETLISEGDDQATTTTITAADMRKKLAFSVFESELGLPPPTATDPEMPIPMYIAKVRHALQSLTGISNDNDANDPWVQRTQAVLDTIQHTGQQLQLLGFPPSSSRDNTLKRHDPSSQHDTTFNYAATDANDQDDAQQTISDMHNLETNDNSILDGRPRSTSGWEKDLDKMEYLLLDLHCILDEYHSWANDNLGSGTDGSDSEVVATQAQTNKRKALVQSVKNAHNSFQKYLEHDQQVLGVFRKRALFTQATAPIRQDLDWVQAEMLKTTTTDNGIKELESRVWHAGILLHQLIQQYGETGDQVDIDTLFLGRDMEQQQDEHHITGTPPNSTSFDNTTAQHHQFQHQHHHQQQHQQQELYGAEVDALVKKYCMVRSWVADVRVWFVEAQRIRHWISERIDILENTPMPDGISSQQLSISADEVEELNTNLEALERELEVFDKEDMSRLRKHVKDLTVETAKEKDLSPADTTTIEITFTTLTTLEQLKHLLNRHSYDLQILTLRVFWENEYAKTTDWVGVKMDELGDFIKSEARWQEGPDVGNSMAEITRSKTEIIDKLLSFELEISTFDQGQFTTTVNLYQEMDDTSKVELPGFLESRQVGIEEKFEALVHRASFARHVVEQYLTMVDFMESTHRLLYTDMDGLYERLDRQTDGVYKPFLNQRGLHDVNSGSLGTTDDDNSDIHSMTPLDIQSLMEEHTNIQEQAVRLITETAALIPNTETTYASEQKENDNGNNWVQSAIKSRSSELIVFGESLEQKLNQYRQALEWNTRLDTVHTFLQQLQKQIDFDTNAATRMIHDLITSFGDQATRLSDELMDDDGDNWNQQLQYYKQKIGVHQNDFAKLDGDIQDILNLRTESSATIPTSAWDAFNYLENGATLAGSALQNLAGIIEQWESVLCMVKNRQIWEAQYHRINQWISTHEQKCQHIRMEATWSSDEVLVTHETANGHIWDAASALKQEWNVFKGQSLPPLLGAFGKLIDGVSSSSSESKWVAQQQRQDSLVVKVNELGNILSLVMALLEQRKAITDFLIGAQDIRSQGTRRLNLLMASVLQHHMDENAAEFDNNSVSLDIYNAKVEELWEQWKCFDNNLGAKVVAKDKQDDLGTPTDLNRHCDSVEKHASAQYDLLLSLGKSLEQWECAIEESKGILYDIDIWGDKVHLLNGQVMDVIDTLIVKKGILLSKLTLGHATEGAKDNGLNGDSQLGGKNQDLETLDRLIQQWQDHEFGVLVNDGSDLNHRIKAFSEKLVDLGYDRLRKDPLGIIAGVDSVGSALNRLQSQCETEAKPLLSLVQQMVKASGQRNTWGLEWINLSSYSKKLQDQLRDIVLDKEHWVQNIYGGYSMDTRQHIAERVAAIILDIDTGSGQQLVNAENFSYTTMEQLYQDINYQPTLVLPTELQSRHTEIQQSIPSIQKTLKRLETDTKWLGTGASWLKQVDEQLESWQILMEKLVEYTNRDVKWTVGSNENDSGALDLDTTLADIRQRADSLGNIVDTALNELQQWKLAQPNHDNNIGDFDEMELWRQKALELETYRSDASCYLTYASNMLVHRKMLQKWWEKVLGLDLQGKNAKAAILAENGERDAGELGQLVADFDHSLTQLVDGFQNVGYPRPPDLSNQRLDPSTKLANSNTNVYHQTDSDDILHHYILSRHEQLKETSASLRSILDAKERSARLKALADGHIAKALESLQWIKTTDGKLQHIVSGDVSDWEIGLLESKLGMVHDLEKSAELHADAYYHGLKDSADYCIDMMYLGSINKGRNEHGGGEDAGDMTLDDSTNELQLELDRITNIQLQVDVDWNRLNDSLHWHVNDLKSALRQAELMHLSNQIMEKCKTVDDQISSIRGSNLVTIQDQKLEQWQQTINEIKSADLKHLSELVGPEEIENLDGDSLVILDSTANAHRQLENRMTQIYLRVQHERQKSEYSNLALDLLDFIDNVKTELMEQQIKFSQFSTMAAVTVDEAQYDSVKVLWDSIRGKMVGYEQKYEREGKLFLLVQDGVDGIGECRAIDEQHGQVTAGWADLQQGIEKSSKYYHSMTQRRPILDLLHHASSILENIDNSNDDDDTKQQIDRVQRMMTDASDSMKQHQLFESRTMTTDDEKKVCVTMDDIYQQRCDIIINRLESVDQRMQERQRRQHIQQLQHQYQEMADRIKISAEKETLALELPKPHDGGSIESESITVLYGQQYPGWLKQLCSSERVFENLALEAQTMGDAMKSSNELGQEIIGRCVDVYQGSLDKLENLIQRRQKLLTLVRQILAHSKSADNITSWLAHFRKAVDAMAIDSLPTTSNGGNGNLELAPEEDIDGLEVKFQGFEPIMVSLGSMNKTIQDYDSLDDSRENFVASRWKQLAQDRFDEVNDLWTETANALEMGKQMAIKTENVTLLARKIKSLMSIMGDSRDQIEQLQDTLSTIVNCAISTDDNDNQQQNRLNHFKLITRNRDLSAAYVKLEWIKDNLIANGQPQRLEIDQLIKNHFDDPNDDNIQYFLQRQEELDAAWNDILGTINTTKQTLDDEKAIGEYLGMVDDIDILLGSMDEVVLKASPDYHTTTIDNKFSKTELQAKLIELNARYDYYKLNIEQGLQHANDYWNSTITDSNDANLDFNRLKTIVVQHYTAQKARWRQLSDQQVPARQLELKKAMASSLEETEKITRLRISSLPTRKAAATLTPHSATSSRLRPPKTISSGLHPSSALTGQQRLRTVSSSTSLTGHNNQQTRLRKSTSASTSASSLSTKSTKSTSSLSTKSTSSTGPGNKKKATVAPIATKPPNSYVAQAGNALDVEIGRIVNDAPYRVKVKMVPGEVGRYWFGDVNPKLVYCRVLKSKMVMVRVGGGWAELSQFLRDHAKLEGELIIPKQENQHLRHTTIQEGYLETTTPLQRQRKQRMKDQWGSTKQQNTRTTEATLTVPTPHASISSSSSSSSIPIRSISRSTSSNNSSVQQNGYKDGDKFIAVDRHGKQLEVKMTRFSQRSALPTSTTNRRRKGAKP